MDTLIIVGIGILTGLGASKTHPTVNGGWPLAVVAGALGGLLGSALFGSAFAGLLGDVALAGDVAGAALGGIAVALATGFAWQLFRKR